MLQQEPIWSLPEPEYNKILRSVFDIHKLRYHMHFFSARNLAMYFDPQSGTEEGIIALTDAYEYLSNANWNLINGLCFMKHLGQNQGRAIYTRLYLDYVYLLLYSTLEHIATAIKYIYTISDQDINRANTKSLFGKVGKVLKKYYKNDYLTKRAEELFSQENIKKAIKFRHSWVHEQRVKIKGEPFYERRKRLWRKEKDKFIFEIGLGTSKEFDYNLEDYSEIIRRSYNHVCIFFYKTIKHLKNKLLNETLGGRVTFRIFKSDQPKDYTVKVEFSGKLV